MKKYKLLKDLSTWKAGDIFILKENGHLYRKDEVGMLVFIFKIFEKFSIIDNKEWFEEIPEEPKSVFDLKECFENIVTDCEDFKDYLKEWNVFLTKKEAEQELEKRQAIQGIRKYCHENDIKLFSDEEVKEILNHNIDKNHSDVIYFYYIYYHAMDKQFYSSPSSFVKHIECFYFKKEDDVKQIINDCEADLKIIFNV